MLSIDHLSKPGGLLWLLQHCFRGEGGIKYQVSTIFAPDCRGDQLYHPAVFQPSNMNAQKSGLTHEFCAFWADSSHLIGSLIFLRDLWGVLIGEAIRGINTDI